MKQQLFSQDSLYMDILFYFLLLHVKKYNWHTYPSPLVGLVHFTWSHATYIFVPRCRFLQFVIPPSLLLLIEEVKYCMSQGSCCALQVYAYTGIWSSWMCYALLFIPIMWRAPFQSSHMSQAIFQSFCMSGTVHWGLVPAGAFTLSLVATLCLLGGTSLVSSGTQVGPHQGESRQTVTYGPNLIEVLSAIAMPRWAPWSFSHKQNC